MIATAAFDTPATSSADAKANTVQLLTFQLADGVYGIEILHIREIRALGPSTPLPGSPPYVKGIMNLRGAIIPVIDLRARLGLAPASRPNRFAVTIITRIQGKNIGLIADRVNEVAQIRTDAMQRNPSIFDHGDQRFIQGLALHPGGRQSNLTTLGETNEDPSTLESWAIQDQPYRNDEEPRLGSGANEQMIVVLDLERLYDRSIETAAINQLPTEAAVSELSETLNDIQSVVALERSISSQQTQNPSLRVAQFSSEVPK